MTDAYLTVEDKPPTVLSEKVVISCFGVGIRNLHWKVIL